MCISRSRTVIGRSGSTSRSGPSSARSRTFRSRHCGTKRVTGSLSRNVPSPYSDISATPVIGLVIE